MFALVDDETVVALGEGRVDFAELVGGEVQRLAQSRVSGGGGPTMTIGVGAGLVDLGDQSGEGPHAGQVGEAVEIAEAGQYPRAQHTFEAWDRRHDPGTVVDLAVAAMRPSRRSISAFMAPTARISPAMSAASSAKSSPPPDHNAKL